jgi:hypothetical protein
MNKIHTPAITDGISNKLSLDGSYAMPICDNINPKSKEMKECLEMQYLQCLKNAYVKNKILSNSCHLIIKKYESLF